MTAIFASGGGVSAEETSKIRAERILRQVDDLWRGESSHAVISMMVKTIHYTRKIRMEAWSKGKDRSLIIILTPLREKGTASLKSGSSIYSYLPKTDRTIRLTAGMMMSSWMGSHFTNDDLVKESRLSDSYGADITFEGVRDGAQVIEFTLIPKPDAAVVWGKIVYLVRSDHLPLNALYYDEDMELIRTMTFDKPKTMDNRLFPTVLRVTPEDKPDEFTELVYEKMKFNIDLDDAFFSISRLKRK
jgi:hypothetical protein